MKSYANSQCSQPVFHPTRKGPEILRTKPRDVGFRENPDSLATEYHCTAEWHFSRMHSKYSALLHSFALHISTDSGRFYCSQSRLAGYFGCSRRAIWTAIHELERAGFFVRISSSAFCTNVYTVLDHSTWAKKNPRKCATKIEMPWSPEGQALGRRLYAISGGRVKFRPQQIQYLQDRFTDEEVEHGFRRLLNTQSVLLDKHGFIRMKNIDWEALCWES
jgi:hypothetical protein